MTYQVSQIGQHVLNVVDWLRFCHIFVRLGWTHIHVHVNSLAGLDFGLLVLLDLIE
jgi:hypothetical protein